MQVSSDGFTNRAALRFLKLFLGGSLGPLAYLLGRLIRECQQLVGNGEIAAFSQIFAGIIGYLAGLPLLVAGFLVTLLLLKIADVRPSHPIQGPIEHGNILVILLVIIIL